MIDLLTKYEKENFDALLRGNHAHPHDFLGLHPVDCGQRLRVWLRDVRHCAVFNQKTGLSETMQCAHQSGFFVATINSATTFPYQLKIERNSGDSTVIEDPYRFPPTISETDRYLFNEGKNYRIYHHLGAHRTNIQGVWGVAFAVWAPHAQRVSLVGNFNQWDGRYHPLRLLGSSGIWEIFLPGISEGELYKFELRTNQGEILIKTDPFGMSFEGAPNHAARVCSLDSYHWHDEEWLTKRTYQGPPAYQRPISIYEVHLGSWRRVPEENNRVLTYREAARALARYCTEMGFTHVEFLPLMEFPFDGSWGYQVTGYYAPTHRFGPPHAFMELVDILHMHGIGVLLDWVPAHFPRDSFALANFDGQTLFEYADRRLGEHRDWGTLVFNYSCNEVRNFLLANALFWCDHFHVDGFRVDAVASMIYRDYCRPSGQWVANCHGGRENWEAIAFLQELNTILHCQFPGVITIAEESTTFPAITRPVSVGGLGFDFKWNMGWMHDSLEYFRSDLSLRQDKHNRLTFAMLYQYSEHFTLALSHDEVVHGKSSLFGKMPSHRMHEKMQMLQTLLGYMWTWPGKKTIFMGGEFGQTREWNFSQSLDWHLLRFHDHEAIRQWVRALNQLYRQFPWLGFYEDDPVGFRWIDADRREQCRISYARCGKNRDEMLLVACNFSGEDYHCHLGCDRGVWVEILNNNRAQFGGHSGPANPYPMRARAKPYGTFSHSIEVFLPAFTVLVFCPLGQLPEVPKNRHPSGGGRIA